MIFDLLSHAAISEHLLLPLLALDEALDLAVAVVVVLLARAFLLVAHHVLHLLVLLVRHLQAVAAPSLVVRGVENGELFRGSLIRWLPALLLLLGKRVVTSICL